MNGRIFIKFPSHCARQYTGEIGMRIPKGTCPYIAFPFPGERPLIVDGKRLRSVLRGINVTDMVAQKNEDGSKCLVVTHRTGKVRGRYTFVNVRSHYDVLTGITKWAKSERERRKGTLPTVSTAQARIAKQIKSLERKLSKLGNDTPPQSPLLYECESGDYWRGHFEGLEHQREVRQKAAKIAGAVITNRITPKTGYDRLRAAGFPLKTYSQLNTRQRESVESDQDQYWKQVWRFCLGNYGPVQRRDYADWGPKDIAEQLKRHAEARLEYLAERGERKTLESLLADARRMAEEVEA